MVHDSIVSPRCITVSDKGSLRMVPTNTEVFFAWFVTMQEKQIVARDIGIQKENWG